LLPLGVSDNSCSSSFLSALVASFTNSNVRATSVPGPEGMSKFLPAMSKPCRTFGRYGHFTTWAAKNDVKKSMKMSIFLRIKNPEHGYYATHPQDRHRSRTPQEQPHPPTTAERSSCNPFQHWTVSWSWGLPGLCRTLVGSWYLSILVRQVTPIFIHDQYSTTASESCFTVMAL
jgi:hypothetical protein